MVCLADPCCNYTLMQGHISFHKELTNNITCLTGTPLHDTGKHNITQQPEWVVDFKLEITLKDSELIFPAGTNFKSGLNVLCIIKHQISKDCLQTTCKIYTKCAILNEFKLQGMFRDNLLVCRRLLKSFHGDGPGVSSTLLRVPPEEILRCQTCCLL
jgi:hypothetical protein